MHNSSQGNSRRNNGTLRKTGNKSRTQSSETDLLGEFKKKWNRIWAQPQRSISVPDKLNKSPNPSHLLHEKTDDCGPSSYTKHRKVWFSASASASSPAKGSNKIITSETILKTQKPRRSRKDFRRSLSAPSGREGMMDVFKSLNAQNSFDESFPSRFNQRVTRSGFYSHAERIAEQTKDFSRDYIASKLRRDGLLSRVKFSRPPSCDHWVMNEIQTIGSELERRNPSLCKNLSKQIGITLRSEDVLRKIFFEFSLEILTTSNSSSKCQNLADDNLDKNNSSKSKEEADRVIDVSWGRIIAILVICGALACDCITQGHSELVNELIEFCGEFFDQQGIVAWINLQGGWEKICEVNAYRVREAETATTHNIILITVCIIVLLAVGVGIRNFTAVAF